MTGHGSERPAVLLPTHCCSSAAWPLEDSAGPNPSHPAGWPAMQHCSSSHGSAHILNSLYYPNPDPWILSPLVSKSVYWGSFISRMWKVLTAIPILRISGFHQITVGFLNISYLIKSPFTSYTFAHTHTHGAWSIFKIPSLCTHWPTELALIQLFIKKP